MTTEDTIPATQNVAYGQVPPRTDDCYDYVICDECWWQKCHIYWQSTYCLCYRYSKISALTEVHSNTVIRCGNLVMSVYVDYIWLP